MSVMAGSENEFGSAVKRFILERIDRLTTFQGVELSHDGTTVSPDEAGNSLMLLDEAVKCLRAMEADSAYEDRADWASLASIFSEIHTLLGSYIRSSIRPDSRNVMRCGVSHLSNLGRPKFSIPSESLEDLYGIGLTCKEISEMFGV